MMVSLDDVIDPYIFSLLPHILVRKVQSRDHVSVSPNVHLFPKINSN